MVEAGGYAVVDRDRPEGEQVIMVCAERSDAERIAMGLRDQGIRARVEPTTAD